LRAQLAADAERCGRSFEAHVLAILRHHYGESVDIAPTPGLVLALARASFEGISRAERARLTRRLTEPER
jgi:predicted Zn-dependent protease